GLLDDPLVLELREDAEAHEAHLPMLALEPARELADVPFRILAKEAHERRSLHLGLVGANERLRLRQDLRVLHVLERPEERDFDLGGPRAAQLVDEDPMSLVRAEVDEALDDAGPERRVRAERLDELDAAEVVDEPLLGSGLDAAVERLADRLARERILVDERRRLREEDLDRPLRADAPEHLRDRHEDAGVLLLLEDAFEILDRDVARRLPELEEEREAHFGSLGRGGLVRLLHLLELGDAGIER